MAHFKASISDHIVEKIIEHIILNKLSPNDMLPSENKITQEFGVSRLVCREALAKLQGMGIIRSRQGKGVFINDVDSIEMSSNALKLMHNFGSITIDNILEIRIIIEPIMAKLAAQKRNPANAKSLLDKIESAKKIQEKTEIIEKIIGFSEIDVEFHNQIAILSMNPLFFVMLKSINEFLLKLRQDALIIHPEIIERTLKEHEIIANAIIAGDDSIAENTMREHVYHYKLLKRIN